MIKKNDVIEVTMSIELVNVPENLTSIDVADYNRKFNITYFLDKECIAGVEFETEAGLIDTFGDDIEEYLKENLLKDIEKISEYEIFEVNSKEYEYQKAKIKVKNIN